MAAVPPCRQEHAYWLRTRLVVTSATVVAAALGASGLGDGTAALAAAAQILRLGNGASGSTTRLGAGQSCQSCQSCPSCLVLPARVDRLPRQSWASWPRTVARAGTVASAEKDGESSSATLGTGFQAGTFAAPAGAVTADGEVMRELAACQVGGDWSKALLLLRDLRNPDKTAFTAGAGACGRAGRWELVLSLLQDMANRGLSPEVMAVNYALAACEKAGQFEAARQLMQQLDKGAFDDPFSADASRCVPNHASYLFAIRACVAAGEMEEAGVWLCRLRSRGLKPTTKIMEAIASAYEMGGEWNMALDLLEDMRRQMLPASVTVANRAIGACVAPKRWEVALELLMGLKGQNTHAGQPCWFEGIQPDSVSYCFAMSTCAEAGEWKRSMLLLHELMGLRRNGLLDWQQDMSPADDACKAEEFFCIAMKACKQASRWAIGLCLLDELPGYGVTPTTRLFNQFLDACLEEKQWVAAKDFITRMREHGPAPDVVSYGLAISACQRAQRKITLQRQAASSTRETAADPGLGEESLDRPWQTALSLLHDIKVVNLEPDSRDYMATMVALDNAGKWELSLDLWAGLQEKPTVPVMDIWNAVIQAVGDRPAGAALFREALDRGVYPTLVNEELHNLLDLAGLSPVAAAHALRWWMAVSLAEDIAGGQETIYLFINAPSAETQGKVRELFQDVGLFYEMLKHEPGMFRILSNDYGRQVVAAMERKVYRDSIPLYRR